MFIGNTYIYNCINRYLISNWIRVVTFVVVSIKTQPFRFASLYNLEETELKQSWTSLILFICKYLQTFFHFLNNWNRRFRIWVFSIPQPIYPVHNGLDIENSSKQNLLVEMNHIKLVIGNWLSMFNISFSFLER